MAVATARPARSSAPRPELCLVAKLHETAAAIAAANTKTEKERGAGNGAPFSLCAKAMGQEEAPSPPPLGLRALVVLLVDRFAAPPERVDLRAAGFAAVERAAVEALAVAARFRGA